MNLTKNEQAFLDGLPEDTRQMYMEQPELIRGSLRATMAQDKILKGDTLDTQEAVRLSDQELRVSEDSQIPEEPAPESEGFEDIPSGPIVKSSVARPPQYFEKSVLKGVARGIPTAIYRTGDFLKASVIGPVMSKWWEISGRITESVTGTKVVDAQLESFLEDLSKRSDPQDEETAASLGGLIPLDADDTVGRLSQEFTSMGVGLAGFKALAPVAVLTALTNTSGTGAMFALKTFLKGSIVGDVVSSVVGPQELWLAPQIISLLDSPEAADKLVAAYNDLPEAARGLARTAEGTAATALLVGSSKLVGKSLSVAKEGLEALFKKSPVAAEKFVRDLVGQAADDIVTPALTKKPRVTPAVAEGAETVGQAVADYHNGVILPAAEELVEKSLPKKLKKLSKKAAAVVEAPPEPPPVVTKRGKKPKAVEAPVETPETIIKKVEKTKVKDLKPPPESAPAFTDAPPLKRSRAAAATSRENLTGSQVLTKVGGGKGIGILGSDVTESNIIDAIVKDKLTDIEAIAKKVRADPDLVIQVTNKLQDIVGPKRGPKGGLPSDGKIYDLWTGQEYPSMSLGKAIQQKAADPTWTFPGRSSGLGRKGGFDPVVIGQVAVEVAKRTAGGWITPGLLLAADMLDGQKDITNDVYLAAVVIGMGVQYGISHLDSFGAMLPKKQLDLINADLAVNLMNVSATAKGLLSPEDLPKFFGAVGEEVLRGPIQQGRRWVNRFLNDITVSTGQFINYNLDFSNIKAEFPTGLAKGNSGLVNPSALYDRTMLWDVVQEAYEHVLRNTQSVTINDPIAVGKRFSKWITDMKLTQQALDAYQVIHKGDPKKQQALMVALDSYERWSLENLAKAVHGFTPGSLKSSAAVQEAAGHVRSIRKLFTDPASILTGGQENQVLMGKFLQQVPDDFPVKGLGIERLMNGAAARITELKSFLDKSGNLPDNLRAEFYGLMTMYERDPSLWQIAETGAYNAMLSSYLLFRDSLVGNTLATGQAVGSKFVEYPLNILLGNNQAHKPTSEFLVNFVTSVSTGFRNTVETLRTGQKVFDPEGLRMYQRTRAIENFARTGGGGDATAPIWYRTFQRMSELFGVTPATLTKALDVGPQTMLHSAFLGQRMSEMAIMHMKNAQTPMTYAEAMRIIKADPAAVAEASSWALNRSRGTVGIGATRDAVVREGGVEYAPSILGKTIESAAEIQQNNPIAKLMVPFLSTDAFFTNEALRHSAPWQALAEVYAGKEGVAWNVLFNKDFKQFPDSMKYELKARLADLGARVTTGTTIAMSIMGGFAYAGYEYVSSLTHQDKDLKNLGVLDKGFVNRDTGDSISPQTLSNLTVLLDTVNPIVRLMKNPNPTEEDLNKASFAGAVLEYYVSLGTPESLASFFKTTAKVYNSEGSAEAYASAVDRLMGDLLSRANPTVINQMRSWDEGTVLRRPRTLETMVEPQPQRNLLGDTTPVGPSRVLGQVRKAPVDDPLSKAFADNGIDISRSGMVQFAGKRVDDPKLADDFVRITGSIIREWQPFIMEGLKERADNPEERVKMLRGIISDAKDRAKGQLWKRLEEATK